MNQRALAGRHSLNRSYWRTGAVLTLLFSLVTTACVIGPKQDDPDPDPSPSSREKGGEAPSDFTGAVNPADATDAGKADARGDADASDAVVQGG